MKFGEQNNLRIIYNSINRYFNAAMDIVWRECIQNWKRTVLAGAKLKKIENDIITIFIRLCVLLWCLEWLGLRKSIGDAICQPIWWVGKVRRSHCWLYKVIGWKKNKRLKATTSHCLIFRSIENDVSYYGGS